MKKALLEKKLREKGAKFYKQGGSHELWESKSGLRFAVPRHSDIPENTAKAILKQAER